MSFVIAIGGARGAGKSALARLLSSTLRADVLHLGRVRSLLRGVADRDRVLDLSVNEAPNLSKSMKALRAQARLLRPMVKKAVRECRERKASLIVEGAHCLPGFYPFVDIHVVLNVSPETLKARYGKDKIRGRGPSSNSVEREIARNILIQYAIIERALKFPNEVRILDANYLPAAFCDIIRLLPERCIPRFSTDS